jgi:hypothetical protein
LPPLYSTENVVIGSYVSVLVALSIMTLSIMTLSIMTLSIMTLSKMTFSIMTHHFYIQQSIIMCHLAS